MTESPVNALKGVLAGDVEAMKQIKRYTQTELLRCADTMPPLVLSAAALARVLRDRDSGRITIAESQQWASFVRFGFVAPTSDSAPDLDIELETAHEEAIARALERLEEQGEIIDGELRPGEIDQLLAALGDA